MRIFTPLLCFVCLSLAACAPAQPRYNADGTLLVGPDPDSAGYAIQRDNLGSNYNPGWDFRSAPFSNL